MKSFTQYRIAIAHTLWLFKRTFQLLPFSLWVRWWFLPVLPKTMTIGGVAISLRAGLRHTIVDGYMAISCLAEEQYNPFGFELKNGQTVIDIGGHIGSFALYAASRVGSEGRVIAYEPAPDNNAQLARNVAQSGFSNIRVEAAAIAGSTGTRQFFYDPLNTAMHSFFGKGDRAREMPTLTLADVFSQNNIERCHFLKIDCEGAEYEILYNTPRFILEKIDRIAMEYHRPPFYGLNAKEHNPDHLFAFLRGAGFSMRVVPENRMHGLFFASRVSFPDVY